MNARNALLSVSALLAASLASCGTLNRAGKDVFITVGSPILVPYCAAVDAWDTSKSVRAGLNGGAAVEVIAFPITGLYHMVKHVVLGPILHTLDFVFTPFYGAVEVHGWITDPPEAPVMPLDYYQGTSFDRWAANGFGFESWSDERRGGTDAESGAMVPAAR